MTNRAKVPDAFFWLLVGLSVAFIALLALERLEFVVDYQSTARSARQFVGAALIVSLVLATFRKKA